MVGAERQKFFEFNTSTLLERAPKTTPSQFQLEQTFALLLFILFGVPLDTSLLYNLIPCFSFMLHSLFDKC